MICHNGKYLFLVACEKLMIRFPRSTNLRHSLFFWYETDQRIATSCWHHLSSGVAKLKIGFTWPINSKTLHFIGHWRANACMDILYPISSSQLIKAQDSVPENQVHV